MKRIALLGFCLALGALFAALGVWQLERLHWKTQLVARVEARLNAPPREAPPWSAWSPDQAYVKVQVRGVFLHDHETLVLAVTDRGAGYWVMTPLRTDAGVVFINRGFVPAERAPLATRFWSDPQGAVVVTGLLRANEPNGAFLRSNAPADHRWYSRDVPAIANAVGLREPVAPYFIDADATSSPGGYPVGGLTVVRFRNDHLAYAIIWFVLAALSLGAAAFVGGASQGPSRSFTRAPD